VSIVEKILRKVQAAAADAAVPSPATNDATAADTTPSPAPNLALTRTIRIDRDKLRLAALLPPETDTREFAQQYRAIKRPLLRNAAEPVAADGISPRIIMVASALPGEGKTFTSLNLALSIALEKDLMVFLVDGDAARPQLSRALDVLEQPGLLDILADPARPIEAALQANLLATDVPRLNVLPIGKCAESATELISSDRMKRVVKCLAGLHPKSIVLFDSSPLLVTIDSRTISSLVGQVVIVVKAESTPQQALQDTLGFLGDNSKVSLILNQAMLSGRMAYYYGYGYGHADYKEP
jgi:protein-tyrosine kinase